MQNLENSGFKVAEENLMGHIREGKTSILQNREDILNGNIKSKDKYDNLFERLDSINLTTRTNKEEMIASLKAFIKELGTVISNKTYDDPEYLRGIVLKIELNRKNLKYLLEDYEEQVKYENVLSQIKYYLSLKLFESMEKNTAKKMTK